MTTRRAFVGDTAKTLAGLALFRGLPGTARMVPRSYLRNGATAATLFARDMHAVDLHALVGPALEAAKSAGATFADIRISELSKLHIEPGLGDSGDFWIMFTSEFNYGIRVNANGAWAFIHGCLPEPDRITQAARDAVATAKGFATLAAAEYQFAPTTVAQGEWATPVKSDPFKVPLSDQVDLLKAYRDLGNRVLAGPLEAGVHVEFEWTKDFRVFGSTDGTLTTQTIYRSQPNLYGTGKRTYLPNASKYPHALGMAAAGGFETVLDRNLPDQLKSAAETAAEFSRMPARHLDVGRYEVAVDGSVLGGFFGNTIGVALELDRALGYESDAAGISYLVHPSEVLGKKVMNPLLNATANRKPPEVQAVKWDDDGVEPEEYAILKDGVIVDYHTSRLTAPALADWYKSQGKPLRSHGCAVALEASDPVVVQTPHIDVAPGKGSATFEDLYKGITHGLAIQKPSFFWLTTDQALSGGELSYIEMFEVVHGKIVGRIKDAGIQFQTAPLWKGLMALGDQSTVDDVAFYARKGMPWKASLCTTTAPAGLFKDVHVVDTGLRF